MSFWFETSLIFSILMMFVCVLCLAAMALEIMARLRYVSYIGQIFCLYFTSICFLYPEETDANVTLMFFLVVLTCYNIFSLIRFDLTPSKKEE